MDDLIAGFDDDVFGTSRERKIPPPDEQLCELQVLHPEVSVRESI